MVYSAAPALELWAAAPDDAAPAASTGTASPALPGAIPDAASATGWASIAFAAARRSALGLGSFARAGDGLRSGVDGPEDETIPGSLSPQLVFPIPHSGSFFAVAPGSHAGNTVTAHLRLQFLDFHFPCLQSSEYLSDFHIDKRAVTARRSNVRVHVNLRVARMNQAEYDQEMAAFPQFADALPTNGLRRQQIQGRDAPSDDLARQPVQLRETTRKPGQRKQHSQSSKSRDIREFFHSVPQIRSDQNSEIFSDFQPIETDFQYNSDIFSDLQNTEIRQSLQEDSHFLIGSDSQKTNQDPVSGNGRLASRAHDSL